MSPEMELAVVGIVGGLVSGSVVAGVNSLLSHRSFISQQWWERKASAYSDVIRHLAELRGALIDYRVELDTPPVDTAVLQKHVDRWNKAADAVDVIANQEAFLLSASALASLRELQDRRNQLAGGPDLTREMLVREMLALSMAVRDTTETITRLGHEDLNVPRKPR
jgi:hypothetical protein